MTRAALPLLVLSLLVAAAAPVAAQESLLPMPPEEIETIIELLDAVEAAETVVLANGELTDTHRAELEELTTVAERIGAPDVAARARTLLVLSRPPRDPIAPQPSVDVPLGPAVDRAFARGDDAFTTLTTAFAVAGGTALTLSGVFYALAERDYRRWQTAVDPDGADELFQAWRGYELLSLGMGGAAVVSAGVGLPVLYALAETPASLVTAPSTAIYTETERQTRLAALYAERARIVTSLNGLPEGPSAAELISTVALTTGIAGAITSVTMFYLAEETYQEYLEAPFSEDAEALGRRVELFDFIAIVSGGLAAGGFGTSAGVALFTPDRETLEAQLRRTNEAIIDLRMAETMTVPETASGEPDEEGS
ncbi:MAG: hypothetical protein ACOC1U_02975 [Spirochaetota bacterium]